MRPAKTCISGPETHVYANLSFSQPFNFKNEIDENWLLIKIWREKLSMHKNAARKTCIRSEKDIYAFLMSYCTLFCLTKNFKLSVFF